MVEKPTATAKITPEQKAALQDFLQGRSESDFVRAAIREKMLREYGYWPEHEWHTHGGKREGAGRKKATSDTPENGGN